jgi:hypothetical protein
MPDTEELEIIWIPEEETNISLYQFIEEHGNDFK